MTKDMKKILWGQLLWELFLTFFKKIVENEGIFIVDIFIMLVVDFPNIETVLHNYFRANDSFYPTSQY